MVRRPPRLIISAHPRTYVYGPGLLSVAGKGGYNAGAEVQASYPLVLDVGDEQAAATVKVAVIRFPELSPVARTTVATVPWNTGSGHGAYNAGGRLYLANGGI